MGDVIGCDEGPVDVKWAIRRMTRGVRWSNRPGYRVLGSSQMLASKTLPCPIRPPTGHTNIIRAREYKINRVIGQGQRYDTNVDVESTYGLSTYIATKKDARNCACWRLKFVVIITTFRGYPPLAELAPHTRKKMQRWARDMREGYYPELGNEGAPLKVWGVKKPQENLTRKVMIELPMARWVCCNPEGKNARTMINDNPYIADVKVTYWGGKYTKKLAAMDAEARLASWGKQVEIWKGDWWFRRAWPTKGKAVPDPKPVLHINGREWTPSRD